ncbi:histidine kinase [Blautia schinkii]|nr:histidine kinase [Blautia schinkii]
MKILHSKNSILVRFILYIMCSMLIPFVILMAVSKSHISRIEQNNAQEYLSANMNVVSSSIDGILKNVEYFYIPLLMDRNFLKTVETLSPYKDREGYQDYLDTSYIKESLLKNATTNNYIYSIYAYSYNANRFFSSKVNWNPAFHNYNKENSPWLSTYEDQNPEDEWVLTSAAEDGRPILTSYRTIRQNGNLNGLVSINIDAAVVSKQLQAILPDMDSFCFMTDPDYRIISSSAASLADSSVYKTVLDELPAKKEQRLFTIVLDKEKMFVFSFISPDTNFRYFIVSPYKNINTISSMLTQLTALYSICIIFLVLILAALSILIFFRPIRRLFDGMRAVQNGDFAVRLPKGTSYETSYINHQFNDMTENIQKLIHENYEQKLIQKDAEIHNILNQLNEHFLYNTLDSIRWTARVENAPQTSNMVYALATFYRINLSSGLELISVQQVIKMLQSYLTIQEIRMKDQFTYTLDCSPVLEHIKVLKYLFQPIVENCLVHGVEGIPHKLIIRISFSVENDLFRFCVRDNGTGITSERLQQIYTCMSDETSCSMEHFALKMIDRQLLLKYGLPHALFIRSEAGSFCEVGFCIPLEKFEGGIYHDENDHY